MREPFTDVKYRFFINYRNFTMHLLQLLMITYAEIGIKPEKNSLLLRKLKALPITPQETFFNL
jgi:hypothetical protein